MPFPAHCKFSKWNRNLLIKTMLVMKLTAFLLLLGFFHVSANTYGQEKINLKLKNATLQSAFQEIEKQSGYIIWYENKSLPLSSKITVIIKNATIAEALEQCLEGQKLKFSIAGKTIFIDSDTKRNDFSSITEIPVHGRVIDENQQPLEGITVMVKGSKLATSTDGNGEFSLGKVDQKSILLFTSVNTENYEMSLNNQQNIVVRLKAKVQGLQDIVVSKGYYSTSQRYNTGTVSIVKSDVIEAQPISNSLEAIEGRIPGVYIQQNTGVSGGGFTIQIRGQNSLRNTSISNGNLPLYVIDGVPFTSSSIADPNAGAGIVQLSNPLNSIDPNDIESIEVLKDADATAIYGSRGSNGVILISTKRPKTGKTKLDIRMYSGNGEVDRKMNLLNTQQYLEMRHEAFKNDKLTPGASAYDLKGKWDTTRYTDWQHSLYGGKAGLVSTHASLTGGNSNTQFLFDLDYFKEGTVFPGDFADQKTSGHISVNHISDNNRFKAVVSAIYLIDNNLLPSNDPTKQGLILAPVAPNIFNTNGTLNWANSTWINPYSIFLKTYNANVSNLIANANLSYEIIRNLKVRANIGYNSLQMKEERLFPIASLNPAINPTGNLISGNSGISTWIIEPQLDYQKQFGKGRVSLLIGSTFQQNVNQMQSIVGLGYTSDALLENLEAAASTSVLGSNYVLYKYDAIYARAGYVLKDRYLLNLTGRRDGSSRFGPGNQFANFWALGIGWIFSETSFLKEKIPFISFAKVKTSYGTTGSDQIPDYGYLATYSPTAYAYNGTSGLLMSGLVNPNFGWEINKKFEASLDLSFLKERIGITLNYYNNRSSNQLVGYSLPVITGESSVQANLPATVQNTGIEFQLNVIAIKTQRFQWTISGNISFPRNLLVSYPNILASSYANSYVVGKSLFVKNNYHLLGVDKQSGLYQFQDVDKDGQISTPNDLLPLKQIAKNYYGGLENSFKYKGFQCFIFLQFVKQTGLDYIGFFGSPGALSNQPTKVLQRWKIPGDNSEIQKFGQTGSTLSAFTKTAFTSDGRISDASFVRLKNISISYNLPNTLLNKMHLTTLKVFLQAQNLFTITKYIGLDPETQSFQSIPPLKIISAGIQITL